MSKIFLLGHTGCVNRGCEAIVKSTIKLLKNSGLNDIYLCGMEEQYDRKFGIDKFCNYIPIKKLKKYSFKRIFFGILKKFFHIYEPMEKMKLKPVFDIMLPNDIVLIIGGDTYCYNNPTWLFAYNSIAKKKGAKTILWSCSIEKTLITDEMICDLKKYDYIFPREQISYNNLLECGIEKCKMLLMSDSAFNLDTNRVNKYENLVNAVGINVSPIVVANENAYKAICELIKYIVNETDMNVLLVPHVYDRSNMLNSINANDDGILMKIKNDINSEKVSLVEEEFNCEELKYIISKCRFFVGARTHSTIAAYSSEVPTLVLGYSVKSRGIAKDLFGTEDGYAIMYDSVNDEMVLKNAFINIMKLENKIRTEYSIKIPKYKKLGIDAAEFVKSLDMQ